MYLTTNNEASIQAAFGSDVLAALVPLCDTDETVVDAFLVAATLRHHGGEDAAFLGAGIANRVADAVYQSIHRRLDYEFPRAETAAALSERGAAFDALFSAVRSYGDAHMARQPVTGPAAAL